MANICDNTFYAHTEDEDNMNVIIEFFENWWDASVERDGDSVDIYFESKWAFPEEQMQGLFEAIPNKEDIYMRCLSVEYGTLYHALWVCDEDGWQEV